MVDENYQNEQALKCSRYQYDDQGRLTNVFSFIAGKENTGRSKLIEYLEEDGKKKTITRIYLMTPLDENADFFDNTESWKVEEEPLEQYTYNEWVDDFGKKCSSLQNDLTGAKTTTREEYDEVCICSEKGSGENH